MIQKVSRVNKQRARSKKLRRMSRRKHLLNLGLRRARRHWSKLRMRRRELGVWSQRDRTMDAVEYFD